MSTYRLMILLASTLTISFINYNQGGDMSVAEVVMGTECSTCSAADAVPSEEIRTFFSYAITSQKSIHIGGKFLLESLNAGENANIHTNGSMEMVGDSVQVNGYGTYSDLENVAYEANFVPENDINGGTQNLYKAPQIAMPSIDMDVLREQATVYIAGDFTIDGLDFPYTSLIQWAEAVGAPELTGTPIGDPFVLVVDGRLTLKNNINLIGFGILASTGEIHIQPGNSTDGVRGGLTPDNETELALFSSAPIYVEGYVETVATMVSDEEIRFFDAPKHTGSIAAPSAHFGTGDIPIFLHAKPNALITTGSWFKFD